MSDGPIIRVENLGQRYSLRRLRDRRCVALRDVLVENATSLFRRNGRVRDRKSLTSLRAVGSTKPEADLPPGCMPYGQEAALCLPRRSQAKAGPLIRKLACNF